MGDGLVERMNGSLLTLLRSFVDREEDWEKHLQLLLFIYRTTKHATTGLSPHEVLFGCSPQVPQMPNLPGPVVPDPEEYCAALKRKLYDLRELVEANIVHSAENQRLSYDSDAPPQLKNGQQVLLNNPSKRKLSPHWTGPWTVLRMKGPTSVELNMGASNRIVHVNHVRPCCLKKMKIIQPNLTGLHPYLIMRSFQCSQTCPLSAGDEAADPPVIEPHVESCYVTRSGRVVKSVLCYGTWS